MVYRHFPILGPESVRAAEAAECAAEQGRFWEYHEVLYRNWAGVNQGAFSDENLKRFAALLGLDLQQFSSCLEGGRYAGRVEQDIIYGRAHGIRATPSFLIDGRLLEGLHSYDTYRRAIEEALARVR